MSGDNSEEWLKTLQEAEMACRLLIALDVKRRRDGPEKTWLTYYEATSEVLASFKPGAARAFIGKFRKLDAFDSFTKSDGGENNDVFRFTSKAEQRILDELKRLTALLFKIFPARTFQTYA